jgi:hypothetical protein
LTETRKEHEAAGKESHINEACSSETLVDFQRTTRRYMSEAVPELSWAEVILYFKRGFVGHGMFHVPRNKYLQSVRAREMR